MTDTHEANDDEGMAALSASSATSCAKAPAGAIERKRNEANEDGGAECELVSTPEAPLRNEANGDGGAEGVTTPEAPLRNEANAVDGADPTSETAIDMDKVADQTESLAGQGEAVRRHQVGCVTVTRLSTAVGLQGARTSSRQQRRAQRRELARRGSAG